MPPCERAVRERAIDCRVHQFVDNDVMPLRHRMPNRRIKRVFKQDDPVPEDSACLREEQIMIMGMVKHKRKQHDVERIVRKWKVTAVELSARESCPIPIDHVDSVYDGPSSFGEGFADPQITAPDV